MFTIQWRVKQKMTQSYQRKFGIKSHVIQLFATVAQDWSSVCRRWCPIPMSFSAHSHSSRFSFAFFHSHANLKVSFSQLLIFRSLETVNSNSLEHWHLPLHDLDGTSKPHLFHQLNYLAGKCYELGSGVV